MKTTLKESFKMTPHKNIFFNFFLEISTFLPNLPIIQRIYPQNNIPKFHYDILKTTAVIVFQKKRYTYIKYIIYYEEVYLKLEIKITIHNLHKP